MPKDQRLFKNLLGVTEQFMLGKNFIPLTRTELMKKLHLPKEHKDLFKDVLDALVKKKIARFSKGKYLPTKKNVDSVKGIIKLHHRGFGFVTPDDPKLYDQDIFIPKHLTMNAVDGDHVEVEVNPLAISEKGPEGKVTTILKRGRTHLAGIVRAIEWQGETIAYAPLLGTEQRIVVQPTDQLPLHVGDRIVMEVIDWGSKDTETTCRVTHFLGHISQPECDIPAAIEEYDLPSDFPSDVMAQAKAFGSRIKANDMANRKDFRELDCVTIDPDTAKDFDDALSLTKDKKGNYHLGVHIADASHYVTCESPLDIEAKKRANSTYFPGYCLPMLPKSLSEGLLSLLPNVNRLAVSVMMTFNKEGSLIDYSFCRSTIKNKKRFTYKEAMAVLDGKKKSPFKPLLLLMVELCLLLKKKRFERGSIEFAMPDLVVHVNSQGRPIKTEHVTYDITHQLVEEFMLKANEVVATHLDKMDLPITFRVHEEPSEDNMKDFVTLARAFGFELPNKPSGQDLQKLFDEALQTSYGSFLATSYIRRMRLALYSPDNIGHYGLGLTHYCHFTSPIRRYVDLVAHRILLGDHLEYTKLETIANHCSERERISEKAENNVTLLKKLRLLEKQTEKSPYKQYEAVVTTVRNFGVFFEILDFMLEGFFHVSELDDDFYKFDEKKNLLYGIYTGAKYFSGDKIQVMVKDIDLILLQSRWHLAGREAGKKKLSQKKKKRPKSLKKRR